MSTVESTVQEVAGSKAQALLEQIKAGIGAVKSSQAWQDWLSIQSKFWEYSWGNTWLIWLQRPKATRIAGFHRWRELGRWVKKGERGLRILAPLLVWAPKDKNDPKSETVKVIRGFKSVAVFDIAQTEGQDLPTIY